MIVSYYELRLSISHFPLAGLLAAVLAAGIDIEAA